MEWDQKLKWWMFKDLDGGDSIFQAIAIFGWWDLGNVEKPVWMTRPMSLYFCVLNLTKHHAMKTYWEVEVQRHAFLTSTLEGGEWTASHPGRLTPGERASGTPWVGGWVGPRAGLDAVEKRKISSPRRESNPRTPNVQPWLWKCSSGY
jgi:hypothetical protein